MRNTIIIGNWKMHTRRAEAIQLVDNIANGLATNTAPSLRVAVAPPFTALESVAQTISSSSINLVAQNMSDNLQGAHTGEISAVQLKDLGVEMVILGHSERRHIYGEDNEFINRKLLLALRQSLIPILCVGETLEERKADQAIDVCRHQLQAGLDQVTPVQARNIIIAYEPVWAIGTGQTATLQDANAMHIALRQLLVSQYDTECADHCSILYGGSVKPENAQGLLSSPHIDGALVGGASLKAQSFLEIIASAP